MGNSGRQHFMTLLIDHEVRVGSGDHAPEAENRKRAKLMQPSSNY
jgi:hypothetical protein